MAVEMKKYRLADIAEIVISSVDKKTKPGEKIVRLCNFTDVYHNWAIKQSDYDSFMVASASDSNINKLSLKKGFVAFTKDSETRDDIGISTYIADDFEDVVLGYHCALAKPNEDIVYGKYLNAFMSSDYIKKYFELNATGSGMRFTLAVSTMEDMPIMLPSMKVQKKVGDMLSDFDRRIENLRAQNRVLEQTAKTIYDYTFLQCAGKEKVYNKVLNRNIPVDWEVKKLGDLVDVNCSTAKKNEFNEILYLETSGVFENTIEEVSFQKYADAPSRAKRKVKDRTIVYSTVRPEQRHFGILLKPPSNLIVSTGFVTIDAKENVGDISFYLYSFLSQESTIQYLSTIAANSVSSYPSINPSDIESLLVVYPDFDTLEIFNSIITPIFQKRLLNSKQIESLTTQRNALLPLLMTGQIEV
ncbi:MAG: restriction endonuclease subunit S [Fibrobacter sp.]|nr:restriction endonuclease subunit S [Fibrobacter sp.]